MEYKEINGMKIPVLGIGTWENDGSMDTNPNLRKEWNDIIRYAIKLGITHIDTAEIYGNELTEQIIGEAVEPFRREDLFITSKVWSTHLNYKETLKALHSSLKRLKTKYVDLYLIHRPSKDMDLKGTMNALEYLQQQGLVRAIGVSNFTEQQILESQQYLDQSNINAVQNEYNLLKKDAKILDFCTKQKILFIAYRPLMRGQLAAGGISILDNLAKKYDKSQVQIALNWLIAKPQVVTIPKSTNQQHLLENLGTVGWQMTKEDYKALDDI